MKMEWDEAKRLRTLAERGLDFADVADADWAEALTVEDARGDYGERRFVSLVPVLGRLCVVAWCIRGGALRVISLRKANARERKRYGEDQQTLD
ncbi:BrnT family toxin (plasmid) [Gemmobacter fulvus]|uniref:BrnT family toxin n=2 Tax=Gemmobacter fulvus TaxID=2840474 RepID=A0A975S3E3_9RHOB|nr:BrnT family toxin [Gemmobacter fulvus]QWK93124.1 BrnT family toxin [Gemmobacter fulvus]